MSYVEDVLKIMRASSGKCISPSRLQAKLLKMKDELQPTIDAMKESNLLIETSDPGQVDGRLYVLTSVGPDGVKRIL